MLQAPSYVEVATKETLVTLKPDDAVANVADESVHPVHLQVARNSARSQVIVVLGSIVKDSDMVALRTPIQKLQAEFENVLILRAGNQNSHMDSFLKLSAENIRIHVLKEKAKWLT